MRQRQYLGADGRPTCGNGCRFPRGQCPTHKPLTMTGGASGAVPAHFGMSYPDSTCKGCGLLRCACAKPISTGHASGEPGGDGVPGWIPYANERWRGMFTRERADKRAGIWQLYDGAFWAGLPHVDGDGAYAASAYAASATANVSRIDWGHDIQPRHATWQDAARWADRELLKLDAARMDARKGGVPTVGYVGPVRCVRGAPETRGGPVAGETYHVERTYTDRLGVACCELRGPGQGWDADRFEIIAGGAP